MNLFAFLRARASKKTFISIANNSQRKSRHILHSYSTYPCGYRTELFETLSFLTFASTSVFLRRSFTLRLRYFRIRHLIIYARASSLVENNRTGKIIFCAIENKNRNREKRNMLRIEAARMHDALE